MAKARTGKPTAAEKAKAAADAKQVIARNKRARYDYSIGASYEAGLALTGTEVKALRMGRASLADAWVELDRYGEAWIHGMNIPVYAMGTWTNHAPTRKRRLLLHKEEIRKLSQRVQAKGYTVVPLELYFIRGRAKVEIALAQGKQEWDKRETIRRREADREAQRAMAAARLDVPSSAASEIEVDRSCTLCTSGKKHGKPRIAGVNFNMSQVNPLVVGAFSRNSSAVLGVDVETLDARLFSGFARLALSNEERTFYERVAQERPAPVLHLLSVALWTAKEAVLKATGHGLSVVPSLVRVQITDELLDALELAMNEEVPGDLLDSDIPEPTALRVLTQDSLTARATFSAPTPQGGGEAIERSFSLQWIPVALPDVENPEHAQKMLIALAVENPTGGEPVGEYGGEPTQVEAQLLPVATPLELKRLLTD